MAKTVLIQTQVAAMNIDSLNSDAINTSTDLDNGAVVARGALSTTAGQSELFTVAANTGTLTDLWMVYSPEVVIFKSGNRAYKGLSADPRDFTNVAGLPLNIFKPVKGDLITVTDDEFVGGIASLTVGQHANATSGSLKLTANSTAGDGLSFKVLSTTEYISIGNERVTAALLECVKN